MVSVSYLCIKGRGYDTGIPVVNALNRKGYDAKLIRLDSYRLSRTLQTLSVCKSDIVVTEDILLPSLLLSVFQKMKLPTFGYVVRMIGDGFAEIGEYGCGQGILEKSIRRGIKCSKAVVYVSDNLRQKYASKFQNITHSVIPNGVDTEKISPESVDKEKFYQYTGNRSEGKITIATVMNLDLEEKIRSLLNASKIIDKLSREFDVEFFIFGQGKNIRLVKEKYRNLKKTHMIGYVSHEDLCQILPLFDIFFYPSSLDACPNAVLEAMAAGLPIVATRVGGIPEMLVDHYSGLLIPDNDFSRYTYNSLKSLIENSAMRKQYGLKARQRSVSTFSWDIIGNQFVNKVDDIVC